MPRHFFCYLCTPKNRNTTKKMKKYLVLALVLLLSPSMVHAQQLKSQFTRIITLPVSNKVVHSKGNVTFTAPDNLEMLYSDPAGEYLIIDGKMLKTKAAGREMKIDTDKNGVFRKLRNTLLNCINGNYEQAAKDNDAEIKVAQDGSLKTVTLTARKAAVSGYSKIILDYNKKNLPVRMVLEEFGGLLTEFQFKY